MPEVQVKNRGKEEVLSEDEKLHRIEELRKLIEDCNYLQIRTDEAFLTRFLICLEWNVFEAFTRMKKFFKLKFEHPKWFMNRKLSEYDHILKQNTKQMLSLRDKHGRRVYLSKIGNVASLDVHDLAQLDDLWFDTMLQEVETQTNGIVVLVDMSGFSWKLLKLLAPTHVKVAGQKAELLPLKNIEFHVVNSSMFMSTAVSLIFPILSQGIKDQVHFHYNNWPSLHEHLGRECLPSEYGGDLKDVDYDRLNDYLYEHESYLNESLTLGWIENPEDDNQIITKKKSDKNDKKKLKAAKA